MSGIGHNSAATTQARRQLKSFVERIERLEEEKAGIASDIRDVYAEAKGNGFDVKALRNVIRIRKEDRAERARLQETVDLYMHALGMLADLPLGQAAMRRDGVAMMPDGLEQMDLAARTDLPQANAFVPPDASDPPFAPPPEPDADLDVRTVAGGVLNRTQAA